MACDRANNLEDCGLLKFEYEGLSGIDGLLNETELWQRGLKYKPDRDSEVAVDVPDPLELLGNPRRGDSHPS